MTPPSLSVKKIRRPQNFILSKTRERQESASLLNIDDSFRKIIVVKDYISPKRNEKGIVTIGLIDFLLKPELLDW